MLNWYVQTAGVNFLDGTSGFGQATWELYYANDHWTVTKVRKRRERTRKKRRRRRSRLFLLLTFALLSSRVDLLLDILRVLPSFQN
jgi:hypothetical protein